MYDNHRAIDLTTALFTPCLYNVKCINVSYHTSCCYVADNFIKGEKINRKQTGERLKMNIIKTESNKQDCSMPSKSSPSASYVHDINTSLK